MIFFVWINYRVIIQLRDVSQCRLKVGQDAIKYVLSSLLNKQCFRCSWLHMNLSDVNSNYETCDRDGLISFISPFECHLLSARLTIGNRIQHSSSARCPGLGNLFINLSEKWMCCWLMFSQKSNRWCLFSKHWWVMNMDNYTPGQIIVFIFHCIHEACMPQECVWSLCGIRMIHLLWTFLLSEWRFL